MILKSFSEKETEAFGEKLAKKLTGNEILALYGGLGAGKTCFTRGIAKGLSVNENTVHSPTFALLNEYSGKFKVYHFDMYRIFCRVLRLFRYRNNNNRMERKY